jgi:nitrate/TMAO reductase-like tetraheme cytochrome c subunit
MLKRIWSTVRRPNTKMAAGTLVLIGVVGALVIGILFKETMKYTNSTEFCTTCHTMQFPYAEAKTSVHFANRSGVGPGCADCHVPKEFFPLMRAKAMAVKDIYHHLMGSSNTIEKFEARRLQMATHVWEKMRATDSRECRNCHQWDRMEPTKQKLRAQTQHAEAQAKGETCIDCHHGVAHKKPEVPVDPDAPMDFEL